MAIESPDNLVRNSSVSLITSDSSAITDNCALWRNTGGTTLLSTGDDSTGTGLVTVQYDKDDQIAFLVSFAASNATTVPPVLTVTQGSERRGWQRDIGSFTLTLNTTGARRGSRFIVGPFETARFAIKSTSTVHAPEGRNYVKFTASTGSGGAQSNKVNILAFRMPDVQYDT